MQFVLLESKPATSNMSNVPAECQKVAALQTHVITVLGVLAVHVLLQLCSRSRAHERCTAYLALQTRKVLESCGFQPNCKREAVDKLPLRAVCTHHDALSSCVLLQLAS